MKTRDTKRVWIKQDEFKDLNLAIDTSSDRLLLNRVVVVATTFTVELEVELPVFETVAVIPLLPLPVSKVDKGVVVEATKPVTVTSVGRSCTPSQNILEASW